MKHPAAAVAAFIALACAGEAHADLLLETIDAALQEPARAVATWQRAQVFSFVLTAGAFLAGAAIVFFQLLSPRLAKGGAVVLGAAVTLLTALGGVTLAADHRQYQALANQGRLLLGRIEVKRTQLQALPADQVQMRLGLFEDIRRDLNAVLELQDVHDPRQPSGGTAAVVALARAFDEPEAAPAWVGKATTSGSQLYFVGTAHGGDYAATRQAALAQAQANARNTLDERLGPGPDTAAADYLVASARVADAYAEFDPGRRAVRMHVLLSLSRRIAESDLRLYRALHSQQTAPGQDWLQLAAAAPK